MRTESSSEFWVADELPDKFVPVYLEDDGKERTIAYMSIDAPGDVGDAPLRVSASPQRATWGPLVRPEKIEVHDREGFAVPLRDDGEVYGISFTWEQNPGLWLTVAGAEPLSRADVAAVAEGLTPVDATEWNRLKRALSMDTHVGRIDPGATEVEAHSGNVDGDVYRLIVLVPADYPLGPEDRRLNCYRLTFRGDASRDLCDTHPWWLRIGGQLFVFGPADANTREVRIGPYEGSNNIAPTVVATVAIDDGPPGRFYVHPLPEGVCFVELAAVNGQRDGNLGAIGPLPSNPEHAACLATLDE